MDKEKIKNYTVYYNSNIKAAIKKMDEGGIGLIVCVDENENAVGIVTDGDFRRAILQGIDLQNSVKKISNKNYCSLEFDYKNTDVKYIFENTVAQQIPVLKNGKLVDILSKEAFYSGNKKNKFTLPQIHLPVVIMAGGEGKRLDPFTRILPKPLIPLGNQPIIEIIMDKFAQFGMKNFFISVNTKAKMIKSYFEDSSKKYNISYIEEDKPLGTAGALRFLEGKLKTPFFISNCDIIVESDYTKIYKFHKKNNFDITIVGSLQHYTIPYGVCDIENGGILKNIKEKPKYDLLVNTGMYLFNTDILKFIPRNKFFNIPDLIKKLEKPRKKIGVYPVSEKSWIDVGKLTEYKKHINLF